MKDSNVIIAVLIIASATVAIVTRSLPYEGYMTIIIGIVGFLGTKVPLNGVKNKGDKQ